VDPNVVVLNAKVRSGVILIAATPSVVIQNVVAQGAKGAVQNEVQSVVILFAARIVALNLALNVAPTVAPSAETLNVVTQAATGDFPNEVVLNEAVLSVALNAVQDVARGVVIQCAVIQCAVIQCAVIQCAATRCAATQCAQSAVDQCAAHRGAMVDSQDEVLPNDGQGVSLVDLRSLGAVQSEVAQDAALFSVQLPV